MGGGREAWESVAIVIGAGRGILWFFLLQEGEQSPQCLCRVKKAGSSSSCSMLAVSLQDTRAGLPFVDKVQSGAAGIVDCRV